MIRIYGDRVLQARVLTSKTGAEVADALDQRPDQQTRLEKSGAVDVEEAFLRALSSALGFPEKFFTSAPVEEVSDNDLLFRAPKSTTKREKRYLAEFARACGEVLQVLDKSHKLPGVRLPHRAADDTIDKVAADVRDALGYRLDEPIPDLTHQVERAGVPIILRSPTLDHDRSSTHERSERHLAYSTWIGLFRDRPLIVTRPVASWERTRWSLAHEVGHLCLHRTGGNVGTDAENEANRFASELLAPASEVKKALPPHVTLSALFDIKMRWGISIGALIIHLHEHRLITDARFKALRTQLYTRKNPQTGRTWGMDEPGLDARDPERPSLVATWMQRGAGVPTPNAFAAMPDIVFPSRLIREMIWMPNEGRSRKQGAARKPDTATDFELAPVLELRRP